ncbi:hypothetical protein [Parathalassolituus penaei]|uniref:Uncharacterized protein n=1 Tax=Parathalassolituus penaei TaxID=2997323 RepID=A0A9X3EFM5_9GAMM|nr:hypothetical protein [Parathalassolituus penaei]MCY0966629.1 hypothetical protein [Parathalassolituus penaei]
MAIEITQRSTIDGYAQGAVIANTWSLALNKAREASNALLVCLRQAAGSAIQLVLKCLKVMAFSCGIFAASQLDVTLTGDIRMQLEYNLRIEAQSIIIHTREAGKHLCLSHAQFAVSQVARKAIHWQPTDCEDYRNSKMAIEITQRSTIDGYAQGAVTRSYARWLRA